MFTGAGLAKLLTTPCFGAKMDSCLNKLSVNKANAAKYNVNVLRLKIRFRSVFFK